MTYAVAAVIALGALALVAYPLFQRKEPLAVRRPLNGEVEDLHSQREAVYGAIKELDFEYQLGNLSQADYQDLRSEYRQRAAAVLKAMDDLGEPKPQKASTGPDWDERIEAAVLSLRAKRGPTPARLKGQGRFCPSCGTAAEPEDRFCAACGNPFGRSCLGCGAGLEPGDAFCPICGTRVAKGGR